MNLLIPKVGRVNGNGHGDGDVSGRGLRHRVFDTHHDRLEEAVDVATGVRRYLPTVGETADAYGLPVAKLRAQMKARAAYQAAVETTNGAATEITDDTSVESAVFTTAVFDTPEVRVALRRLAASLGCAIELLDREPEAGFDFGPYVLVDAPSGHCVWEGGLPVAGIADALRCLANEQRLPPDRIGEAWADFGKIWK